MLENVKLEKIKDTDFNRIKDIYASENWRAYLKDDEKLKRAFSNSYLFLGAYIEETLVGFVRCVGDGEHIIVVQDLIVDVKYQKNGVGTVLFQHVLDRFASVRMFLVVTDLYDEVDNRFYQKNRLVKIEDRDMIAYVR